MEQSSCFVWKVGKIAGSLVARTLKDRQSFEKKLVEAHRHSALPATTQSGII